MPGVTSGGLPYPHDHEPLADIAQAIQDLAEAMNPARAKLIRTAALAIPNNAQTAPSYQSVVYTEGMTASTATGKLTAQVAGLYIVTGGALWASNATGRRFLQLIRTSGGTTENMARDERAPAGFVGHQVASEVELAVGDTVHLEVFQTSGANLNLQADFSPLVLTARRSAPLQ